MSKLIDYDSNEWDDLNSFPPELWRQRAIYHEVRAETLTKQLQIAREALETIAKTEKTIYPHSMDSTTRFNMGLASEALTKIDELEGNK